MKTQYRVNEQIHVKEVRIVGDGGAEVVPTRQALEMARQQGVDLVEISPNAQPPVCRLIDYSKFPSERRTRLRLRTDATHIFIASAAAVAPS